MEVNSKVFAIPTSNFIVDNLAVRVGLANALEYISIL